MVCQDESHPPGGGAGGGVHTIFGCGLYFTVRVCRDTSRPVPTSRMILVSEVVNPGAPLLAWQFSAGPCFSCGAVWFDRPPVTDSTSYFFVPHNFTVIEDDVQIVWMATPVSESLVNFRSMTLLPSWFWNTVASRAAG